MHYNFKDNKWKIAKDLAVIPLRIMCMWAWEENRTSKEQEVMNRRDVGAEIKELGDSWAKRSE